MTVCLDADENDPIVLKGTVYTSEDLSLGNLQNQIVLA